MLNNEFSESHRTIKWVPVSYGTPSKEISKVLARMSDGFVEEAMYNRRRKEWTRMDGTLLNDVQSWSLTYDSIPPKERI